MQSVNPQAVIIFLLMDLQDKEHLNLAPFVYDENLSIETVNGRELKFSMPSALCSYCLGETRIGERISNGKCAKDEYR